MIFTCILLPLVVLADQVENFAKPYAPDIDFRKESFWQKSAGWPDVITKSGLNIGLQQWGGGNNGGSLQCETLSESQRGFWFANWGTNWANVTGGNYFYNSDALFKYRLDQQALIRASETLGKRLVQFSRENLGVKIGDGICERLVTSALDLLGPDVRKGCCFHYGIQIMKIVNGEQTEKVDDIRPGDIMFTRLHVVMADDVLDIKNMSIYQQNVAGSPVVHSWVDASKDKETWVHRAIPAEWLGGYDKLI